MKLRMLLVIVCVAGPAIFLASCSSTQELVIQGARETFHHGMKLLDKKDYLDAKNTFDIVVKQYPASAYADSAQFYLAQSYYDLDEYITAAFEFGNLYRNYPSSKLAPDARYKIAECYAAQSPRAQLDQANTTKAISAFQDFIDYYPNNPLVAKASEEITRLRNKLAEKDYEIAKLYVAMGYYRAATVYYNVVLEKYHDSDIADKAAIGKVEVLIKRHMEKEAREALRSFYTSYPKSPVRPEANKLAEKLDLHPGDESTAN